MVVTGMGAVSAFGWGLPSLDAIFDGRSAVESWLVSGMPGASEILAAPVNDPLPGSGFGRRVREADRVTQMSVFAAHEAIQMAGLDPNRVGVLNWGTGYGGVETLDAAYTRWLFNKSNFNESVPPATIPKAMVHSSAAGIAASLGMTCPAMTYSCACASSSVAIGEAILAIQFGRCDVALVGGSEASLVPGVVKAWEALGALAQMDRAKGLRGPFDFLRNGLILGEGAACLVLESASHAARRGAKVIAKCLGYGINHDPECVTHPHAAPQIRVMREALRHAQVSPDRISYINAHATGTKVGDASEISALNAVFEGSSALVSSTKAATGHLMGASGALESLISICALRTGRCPPNVALLEFDPEIQFDIPKAPAPLRRQGLCMNNSFAFGGTNVSLVFGAPREF